MPQGLKRYYSAGHLHFITCSFINGAVSSIGRDANEIPLVVLGYVVMPEHFHLLISEPKVGDPSKAMQVVKQRFAQRILRRRKQAEQRSFDFDQPGHVWQARFYDFNVWSERKRLEKLRYMHRNPVKRGLVLEEQQWAWSSFRWYWRGEVGSVRK